MQNSANTHLIKKVIIIGGGTAGWLTANHLAKKLSVPGGVTVTLVESPNIPTIGVGEGTVPAMRDTLEYFGIDEGEFITRCDATFKQSIKFVNWVRDPAKYGEHYYHHLFDYPYINDFNSTPYWLAKKNNLSFTDVVSAQGKLCDLALGPKKITDPQFKGQSAYAYHLDAAKFTQMLTEHGVNKLGVQHIKADIGEIALAPDGSIEHVKTEANLTITGDIFVDCTGFKSLLLGEKLGVKFIDKQHVLFADHALAIQVPYQVKNQDIASSTISTAQTAGWIWDIGLSERRGVGHVYSSSHTSHEQAEQDFRAYLGHEYDHIDVRKIKMQIGYREKFWHKNCVAIGLSQGFVEPLEATGLLVFDVTARMLADLFPAEKQVIPLAQKRFNERVQQTWERVIDFIKLHYCISKRDDSAFWRDNTCLSTIPDSLQDNLEYWRYQIPTNYDFHNKLSIFNLDNYLYVLYGMDFDTDINAQAFKFSQQNDYQHWLNQLGQHQQQIITQLPRHRELIEKIKRFGLQAY